MRRNYLTIIIGVSIVFILSGFSKRIYQKQINRNDHGYRYQVIDTTGFYLYKRFVYEEVAKGKELTRKEEYFFSQDAGSPIIPLSISNLKQAFPDKIQFHYLLDAIFKGDRDLLSYDSYSKMYKVKYLYFYSFVRHDNQ